MKDPLLIPWIFLVSQPQLDLDGASKYLIQANILAAPCLVPFVDQLTEDSSITWCNRWRSQRRITKSNDHQEVHRDDSVTFTNLVFCGHLSQRRAILGNYSAVAQGHWFDWLGVANRGDHLNKLNNEPTTTGNRSWNYSGFYALSRVRSGINGCQTMLNTDTHILSGWLAGCLEWLARWCCRRWRLKRRGTDRSDLKKVWPMITNTNRRRSSTRSIE